MVPLSFLGLLNFIDEKYKIMYINLYVYLPNLGYNLSFHRAQAWASPKKRREIIYFLHRNSEFSSAKNRHTGNFLFYFCYYGKAALRAEMLRFHQGSQISLSLQVFVLTLHG
jgi:hypothetical protein